MCVRLIHFDLIVASLASGLLNPNPSMDTSGAGKLGAALWKAGNASGGKMGMTGGNDSKGAG